EVSMKVESGTVWRFIGLQLVFGVVVALGFGLGGVPAGLLALLAVVLIQPGCIMSLAIDGDFGRAIDPSTAFGIIARVGAPYFAVFGLLLVIQASAATAGNWLAQWMPALVGSAIVDFFSFWGLFSAFHLMGWLVWQYHEELG